MGGIVRVDEAATAFEDLIGRFGRHAVVAAVDDALLSPDLNIAGSGRSSPNRSLMPRPGRDTVYEQPYVYLTLHAVQMRAQGWAQDFEEIAAVSGASALFGYEPNTFAPKYAHLLVPPAGDPTTESVPEIRGIDQRIATATGYGYSWQSFSSPDEAWTLLRQVVDRGLTAKGHDWEGVLFGGYRDTTLRQDRWIFAMADGPETYSRWLSWDDFADWASRVIAWNQPHLGCFSGDLEPLAPREIALRVLRDLVAWSEDPPDTVTTAFPKAQWGLAGIEAYAADCADVERYPTWVACHDINPQWTIRNATGIYLERVVARGLFDSDINRHLTEAARHYRAAFECWTAFYRLLGHGVTEDIQAMPSRRQAGSAVVRAWLAHERAALAAVSGALALA